MRIYLDMCCLNRPFDDQEQDRIRLETEAVLIVLAAVERGEHEIVSSEALELENDRNPDPARRERVRDLLSLAKVDVLLSTDRKLVGRAERLREQLRVSVRNPVLWVEEK